MGQFFHGLKLFSYNLTTVWSVNLSALFYRPTNGDSEKLSDLLKFTQHVNGSKSWTLCPTRSSSSVVHDSSSPPGEEGCEKNLKFPRGQ
jgi:hypothetical protein